MSPLCGQDGDNCLCYINGIELTNEIDAAVEDAPPRFFFSPLPLLLAYGTMGIEMAIAPLWVKGKRKMTESSKIRTKLYSEKCHMSGKHNTCCAAS